MRLTSLLAVCLLAAPEGDGDAHWQDEMFRAWNRVWRELFGEAELPRRREVALQRFTISVLSGLASMQTFEGDTARAPGGELALLKRTLVQEMAGADAG